MEPRSIAGRLQAKERSSKKNPSSRSGRQVDQVESVIQSSLDQEVVRETADAVFLRRIAADTLDAARVDVRFAGRLRNEIILPLDRVRIDRALGERERLGAQNERTANRHAVLVARDDPRSARVRVGVTAGRGK